MKKLLSLTLALLLLVSLCTVPSFAASATFSLSASGSVVVGNQIKVSISLSGSEKIGSWRFSLSYDPAYLEYVSGADSGGGGAVSFADSSDGVTSLSKTVTFRAKKIGKVTVSLGSAQVVSFDSVSNMSVNTPSRTIDIVAAPTLSAEKSLSELMVSAGDLTPAFQPGTTNYTLTVPFEIASLTVSATPKDLKASVAVTGADALAVGENRVDVIVTAENGSTQTYRILVTRAESELAGVTAKVEGTEYRIAHDPADLEIPEGYTPTSCTLGEQKFLAYASPKGTICIAYLYNEESGGWYLFHEKTQTFTPFLTLSSVGASVVVLTPDEMTPVPGGFLPCDVLVGERVYPGFSTADSKESGVYLIYGMKADGDCGFFYFDTALQSFAAFISPVDSAEEAQREKEWKEMESSLKEAGQKADLYEIVALALAIVSLLLLIGLVLSLVLGKKKKKTKEKPEKIEATLPEEKAAPPIEKEATPVARPHHRSAKRTLEEIRFKSDASKDAPEKVNMPPAQKEADIPDVLGVDPKE